MSSTINYTRPTYFSQKQVRLVAPVMSNLFGATSKMIDVEVISDVPAYLPPTLGIYSIIKRCQILLDGKIQDINTSHREFLSYVLPTLGSNQILKDKHSVLFGTGVCKYDPASRQLTMKKTKVSTLLEPSYKFEIVLPLLSNLLSQIGVVQQKLEIVIDFVDDIKSVLIPVDPNVPVTVATVSIPYFSYETLQGDYKQPSSVEFTSYVNDSLVLPQISEGVRQKEAIRTNSFNGKTLTKLLIQKTPLSFVTRNPNADALAIYQNFNNFVSIPLAGEWTNFAYDGLPIIDFNNIQNQSHALALATMAIGPSQSASLAHMHTVQSPLLELKDSALNGWFGYSALEINKKISRDLVMQIYREGQDNTEYPTMNEQYSINLVGLVRTAIIDGQKVYL